MKLKSPAHLLALAALCGWFVAAQDAPPAEEVQPEQPEDVIVEEPVPDPLPDAQPPVETNPPAQTTPPPAIVPVPTPRPTPRSPALPRQFPRPLGSTPATTTPAVPPAFPTLPGARPGTVPTAGTSTNASPEPLIEINEDGTGIVNFKNTPLEYFLEHYQEEAQRVVLRAQNLPLQSQINLKVPNGIVLTREERLQMYDTILALNGITMIPTGEKSILAVPATQAKQEGGAFSDKEAKDYAEASQFVTHVVKLKHIEIEEAVATVEQFAKNPGGIMGLPTTKTIIIRDYAINVKRMLEVLEKIDIEVENDYELEVIPIRYGRVEDIYATMSSVISGGGGGGGAATSLGAGTALGQQGVGGFQNRGTQGGFNSSARGGSSRLGTSSRLGAGGFNNYGGNYTPFTAEDDTFLPQQVATPAPTRAGTTFQNRLNQLGRGGQTEVEALVTDAQITPDPRSNSLVVYASKKDMAMIKKVLEKVDTLLPQVLIEGIVMNVSLNNTFDFGVAAGQRPRQLNSEVRGGGTLNNAGNPLSGALSFLNTNTVSYPSAGGIGYLAQLGSTWDVAISALAADGRADVVQRPRIITSHAVSASFFVGSSIPYRQGGFSFGGQNNFYYQQLPVGIGLDVTPYITPDNLVVMEIAQNVDAVDGTPDPTSEVPPTTSNKSANAIVTVRSGDVVLLGGFLENNKQTSNSGVPVLKDIPLLGNLFKRRADAGKRSELMILVRPTILPRPQDLAEITTQQRQDSGNIQELERRMQEDDEASKRQAETGKKKRGFWSGRDFETQAPARFGAP